MPIWEDLKEIDKKGLFTGNNNTTSYSTGILTLDYAIGYWTKVMNEDGELVDKPMLGIPAGNLISLISESGGGKTTFGLQVGWNIVKKFENGMLFMIDCEKTLSPQRMFNLIHTSYDDPRVVLDRENTSIEDVLSMFNHVCEIKEAGGKKYQYKIEHQSFDGKPFYMYTPTVFIIDSLPSFNSRDYNIEDLGNQIDQMKASKDITRFYTNILDRCWKYNIIFIVINHIRPATITNPYQHPPRGIMMINPMTETLPRGSVPQYFSNMYFRLRTTKSQSYTVKDYGFNGYRTEIQIAKTKTNQVGTSFPVTFNTAKGFDPIFSIYEFADSLGLIQGRQPYLSIKGFTEEDHKFDRKQFNSLMISDLNFRKRVLEILKPYYEALLGDKIIMNDNNEVTDYSIVNGEKVDALEYGSITLDDI